MPYKWKPSKSQKRAFAERMQNPDEQAAYYKRKEDKAAKRRSTSNFDYYSAGGEYVPTKEQHDFAFDNIGKFDSSFDEAANMVISGYSCNMKVHHDFIHVINEKRRSF